MKYFFFVLVSVFLILSCNSKEKFEGKWTHDELKINTNKQGDLPFRIIIENDSIKFDFRNFQHMYIYPLRIKNGKLLFNNWSLKAKIEEDTLTLNNIDYYIKDENDSVLINWWGKHMIDIDLPGTNYFSFTPQANPNNNDELHYYVMFGKRLDNDEYSLQLNDKYAKTSDLLAFLYNRSCHGGLPSFPTIVLYIDKTTPLKYIEDIFYYLKISNKLKIKFVNDILLKFNDTLGIYYDYHVFPKILPPFRENDNYRPNKKEFPPPPPPPPYYPMFDEENLDSKFIYLKKDKFYCEDKVISTSELKSIIKPWIQSNKVIFSLYDLESTYGEFLEMNAIINSVYEEVREYVSIEKYKQPYKDLTREQITEIKMQIRMYHIWSYSIPHFNHVIKGNGSFFGLKVPSSDSVTSSK